MSKTQFVEFGDRGFWAYDVSLSIFLKHLIDVAEPRVAASDGAWLVEQISDWRAGAVAGDLGFSIDVDWLPEQIQAFAELGTQACDTLAAREYIHAHEITSWDILEDMRINPRGETMVRTAPIVELGRAIIALANGSLPEPPAGTIWLYGAPNGRQTI